MSETGYKIKVSKGELEVKIVGDKEFLIAKFQELIRTAFGAGAFEAITPNEEGKNDFEANVTRLRSLLKDYVDMGATLDMRTASFQLAPGTKPRDLQMQCGTYKQRSTGKLRPPYEAVESHV